MEGSGESLAEETFSSTVYAAIYNKNAFEHSSLAICDSTTQNKN